MQPLRMRRQTLVNHTIDVNNSVTDIANAMTCTQVRLAYLANATPSSLNFSSIQPIVNSIMMSDVAMPVGDLLL